MCDKCENIDAEIAYYKRLLTSVDDHTAITLLNALIADFESDKAKLHPPKPDK